MDSAVTEPSSLAVREATPTPTNICNETVKLTLHCGGRDPHALMVAALLAKLPAIRAFGIVEGKLELTLGIGEPTFKKGGGKEKCIQHIKKALADLDRLAESYPAALEKPTQPPRTGQIAIVKKDDRYVLETHFTYEGGGAHERALAVYEKFLHMPCSRREMKNTVQHYYIEAKQQRSRWVAEPEAVLRKSNNVPLPPWRNYASTDVGMVVDYKAYSAAKSIKPIELPSDASPWAMAEIEQENRRKADEGIIKHKKVNALRETIQSIPAIVKMHTARHHVTGEEYLQISIPDIKERGQDALAVSHKIWQKLRDKYGISKDKVQLVKMEGGAALLLHMRHVMEVDTAAPQRAQQKPDSPSLPASETVLKLPDLPWSEDPYASRVLYAVAGDMTELRDRNNISYTDRIMEGKDEQQQVRIAV